MSFESVVAIALAVNLVCALICAFVASRSGHDAFSWALAGGLLGPFGVVALLASRGRGAPSPVTSGNEAKGTLIPTDGSDPSLAAVDYFIETHRSGSHVTLLLVLPVERTHVPRQELDAEIESNTGEAQRRLRHAGMRCRVETRFGDAAAEIVSMAAEGGFHEIIMGRRGRGGVAKLVLGSVSAKVTKEAPVPVTVAG